MATTDITAVFDYHFIKEFTQYLPKESREWFETASDDILMSGMIQRDRLIEVACSTVSGKYTVISEDGRDFSDDSDMKSTTCNYRAGKGNNPNVLITSISNKVGDLRVVTLDPKNNTFHYFYIWDYASVRSYGRIEFGLYSNSKYVNGECGKKFDTFEEMAKYTHKIST